MSRELIESLESEIGEHSSLVQNLLDEMKKVIVGQRDFQEGLVIALLCDGHVLIEGVPGLAKTLAARTLSRCLKASFSRIQFTPDLLPADLTGTMIYRPEKASFEPHMGPIFTQCLLADEINRAPAKVQSALLEAMQERQVTFGGITHKLPEPFFVMATQNPIEQEGTYPLPEAQIDRFLMKLNVDYPTVDEELEILQRMGGNQLPQALPVLSTNQIANLQKLIRKIIVEDSVRHYMIRLVFATRNPRQAGMKELSDLVTYGASPRATLALLTVSRALAFLKGEAFVTPEAVKEIAHNVLRHRIIRSFEAEAENVTVEEIIQTILNRTPVK